MIQADTIAPAAAVMLVEVAETLQVGGGGIEQQGIAGTVKEEVAYNHKVDEMAVDGDLEVAFPGNHMVGGLEAASQFHF